MGAQILLINGNSELEAVLRDNLGIANVRVAVVRNELEVEREVERIAPDLIVLNAPRAETSVVEMCRRLRARNDTGAIAILLLTGDTGDLPDALGAGADDHLIRPFSVPELAARIHALLRRIRPSCLATSLAIGDIELDRKVMRVWRAGRPIRIGLSEYRLLEFLMEHVGRVFSREQLIEVLWDEDAEIDVRTVDVHIGRLRAALIRGREKDPIRTVRGAGYAFNDLFTVAPVRPLRKSKARQGVPNLSRHAGDGR